MTVPALDPSVVHRVRPARAEAAGALVLLHGRGADEHDLWPVLDLLDPEGRLVGITLRGPLALPPGGAHWYVVPQVGYPDPETFGATFAAVGAWLDRLPEALGLPWERVVLGGFSQGAVMSYALGLGAGRPSPAGVIALSGFVPTVPGFTLDLERVPPPPVAIAHGTDDPIISVDFARRARAVLEGAGIPLLYAETPMGHTIDPAFLRDLRSWLEARTPAAGQDGAALR